MANLYSMRSELNSWKGKIDSFNQKIKKLKKRRSDVESVKKQLGSATDNNSEDVNNRLNALSKKLGKSMDYMGKFYQMEEMLLSKRESDIDSDFLLSAANNALQKELNDINNKLGEAESELANAKNKVSSLKNAISSEERKQREEALRRAREEAEKKIAKILNK